MTKLGHALMKIVLKSWGLLYYDATFLPPHLCFV